MYTMRLTSAGNPDFRQFAPISNPETVTGNTLQEMKEHCERYIKYWDLGGGNWKNPVVKEGRKKIGYFSYNGRFWSMTKSVENPYGIEIVF